jgi:hypothetical protein
MLVIMVFSQISYAYILWLINSKTYKDRTKVYFDVYMKCEQRTTLFRMWFSRLWHYIAFEVDTDILNERVTLVDVCTMDNQFSYVDRFEEDGYPDWPPSCILHM